MAALRLTSGEEIYFLGNPGVGKSTLMNGLMGKIMFRSALDAVGVTSIFSKITDPSTGRDFCDTPGLDEPDKQEQAAKEIVRAFRHNLNKRRKIIFVVTLEGGRVRNADLVTMRAILDSIHVKANVPVPYGVVINKVPQKTKDKILQDRGGALFGKICASLVAGGLSKNPPTDIIMYPRLEELEDEDNVLHQPLQALEDFLQGLPSSTIEKVDDISMGRLKKLTEQISELTKDNELLNCELTTQMKEFTHRLMKMDAEHKKEKAATLERHRNEMIAREKEFQAAVELCMKRQDEQAKILREEMKAVSNQHANKIEKMRQENHERELDMMRLQAKKDESLQLAMQADREDRDRNELARLKEGMRELRESHKLELNRLKQSHAEERDCMREASRSQEDAGNSFMSDAVSTLFPILLSHLIQYL